MLVVNGQWEHRLLGFVLADAQTRQTLKGKATREQDLDAEIEDLDEEEEDEPEPEEEPEDDQQEDDQEEEDDLDAPLTFDDLMAG